MGLYENPPYYLTAYGIAVKRGFVGTELEWLESLVGKSVELRYDPEINALQWRNIGDSDWHDLMELEALQSEVITATLEELNQAKAETQTARDAALSAQSSAAAAAATATGRASAAETARTQAQTAQQKAEDAQKKAETAAASVSGVAAEVSKATQAAATATSKAQQASQSAASAAEQAAAAAEARTAAETAQQKAQAAAETVSGAKDAAQRAETAAQTAQTKAEEASSSAASAARDAQAAADAKTAAQTAGKTSADKAVLAQSWAVGGTGTREDEDVNNAKFWSENAQNAAGGGVTSFCGRSGAVLPQKGDYTAQLVGARPDTWTPTAQETGADPAGTAAAAVQAHQQAGDAHAALFEAKADRTLSNLTDPQMALYNLGAGVRPSHLINGYFTVNQEKWTGTPSAENQKIHDMWVLSWTPGGTGHAYALTDGGVSITSESVVGNDPGGVITNKFEEPIDGEWTLSVLMKIDSLPAGSYIAIQIANDTKQAYPGYSINSEAAQMEKYAIYTLTANISGWEASDVMRVSVYNYGGPAAFAVKSVKLEPGAKQTHARLDGTGVWKRLPQPDEDYAVQLAKCQRYYQLYSSAEVRPNSPIDCRPTMRTPEGGKLTQGTIVIDDVTYYYNSAEL